MNTPQIRSLNIGLPQQETFYGKIFFTGICKQPVREAIFLSKHGFDGDGVADTKHHGGADKAVCVFSLDHYPHWEITLGIALPPAAFGENLSVVNLQEQDVCIGDIFQLGAALVQISQPRQPCSTLAARYNRRDLIQLLVNTGHTGWYFRVVQEGMVEPGTPLLLKDKDTHQVTVADANQIFHHDKRNREGIEKILAVPVLSTAWRKSFEELLEKIERESAS